MLVEIKPTYLLQLDIPIPVDLWVGLISDGGVNAWGCKTRGDGRRGCFGGGAGSGGRGWVDKKFKTTVLKIFVN